MSIIQKIREKPALIIAVIAFAMIAFILGDYFLSQNKGSGVDTSTTIGEVNGKEIDFNAFQTLVAETESGYRQQGMDINEDMRAQLIDMLWNTEVDEAILTGEYEKLGIEFTSADLNEALYGSNPPPVLAQQFKNEQTGAYDANAARQFINSMRKKKTNDPQRQYVERNIIDYLIKNGLRVKYSAMLAGSVYYPKWLSDKDITDQSSIASISYVAIPYAGISDSTIKVSDDEINAYVRKHKNEFKQEESRSISYILFDASPTAADSAYAYQEVSKLKQAFFASTDAAQFINANNSSLPFFDGYVLKTTMQVPNADSIRSLPVGATYGPYLDAGNIVIAKMLGKKDLPDSVKCRHVLIATNDQQSGQVIMSDSAAAKLIDSIKNAINGGANWGEMVKKYNPPTDGSRENNGEMTFTSTQIQSPNFAKEFAQFILFDGKQGKREVVKTSFGYHFIEILEQKKFETAYKIAYYAQPIAASDETVTAASTAAAQFAAESRNAKQFETAARNKKLSPRIADVKPNDYTIVGIGSARSLVKWIYENKKGNVSEPTNLGDKFIVALIAEEREEGLPDAKTIRPVVENTIRNQKKAAEIISKIGNNRDLNAISGSFKTNVLRADSISFLAPFVPGVGAESKLIGAAFNPAVKGKVSDPIPGNTAVFVIKTESTGLKPAADMDYTMRRMQMEQEMKQTSGNNSVQALRKAATIKDRRIKFY